MKNQKTIFIFYGILLFILFVMSGFALSLSWADIDCDKLVFSLEKTGNLLGVFVSMVGLFITAYFVVLAINAYSHIKEIEKTKNTVDSHLQSWGKKADELNEIHEKNIQYIDHLIINYSEMLYDELGAQIAFESLSNISQEDRLKRKNSLKLRKSRMCYTCTKLNDDLRIKLLLELADIGEKEDIIPIQEIIDNQSETKFVRGYAELVLEELKKKHGI